MENTEEIFNFLEDFSKRKPKTIPQELNNYLAYVARTGDPVYQWSIVKCLFKEKLLNVLTDFYETNPGIEIPPYPNVDPFNYDIMKNSLIEKLDSFNSAPFTVQRICELLTFPRKQYNRIDKYMRAIEKNILVVSTREPGHQRHPEPENGEPMEPIVNGSDNNSDYNVDVEMEDMSWKENSDSRLASEPQPSSSDAHISVDDIEARLQSKGSAMDTQTRVSPQYESLTPPELNLNDSPEDTFQQDKEMTASTSSNEDATNNNSAPIDEPSESKTDVEMKCDNEEPSPTIVIPEIKVDDAEMTELKLREEKPDPIVEDIKNKNVESSQSHVSTDESSSDSTTKEEVESKPPEVAPEVSSSEESSSSSDNTDGNSNSPKDDQVDVQEEPVADKNPIKTPEVEPTETIEPQTHEEQEENHKVTEEPKTLPDKIESDNYSISDVQSELTQVPIEEEEKTEDTPSGETDKKEIESENNTKEEAKEDSPTPIGENLES